MKLRPCPYCGTDPEAIHIFDGEEIVRCPNEGGCAVQPEVIMNTARDAQTVWNERMANLGRLENMEAKLQWQPIETAPRDGTYFLIHEEGRTSTANWPESCEFPGEYFEKRGLWSGTSGFGKPSHWMPLPPPPETKP